MKNSLIIILLVILLIVGGVLYFFRDNIKGMYEDKAPNAQETIINANQEIKDTAVDVKKDIVEGVQDLKK